MRIVVCVEQVYDPKTVKISRSREELDLREAVRVTSKADKYALEAALRLREAAQGEVTALVVGEAAADDACREAVAMGADRAVLVAAGEPVMGKAAVALLAAAIQRLGDVDLVLTGEAETLFAGSSVGARLAAALGWPLVMDAVHVEQDELGVIAHVRFGDGGTVTHAAMPAVVAVAAGVERPRYPHPSRIANAWNEGLVETWPADELGVEAEALAPELELGGLVLGPERTRGQVLSGAPVEAAGALVEALRNKRLI